MRRRGCLTGTSLDSLVVVLGLAGRRRRATWTFSLLGEGCWWSWWCIGRERRAQRKRGLMRA